MDHDGSRIADGIETPDAVKQVFPAEDDAGMSGEEYEEFVFFVGQDDFVS